jgi:hypothetical protein
MAAGTLANLANTAEVAVTIVDAGAIPLLGELLGPGYEDEMHAAQRAAARTLMTIADTHAASAVIIASSGAIPPLVKLLGLAMRLVCR